MKALWTPERIMRELVSAWNDHYSMRPGQKSGCIGLYLSGEWYYIEITRERIELKLQTELPVVVSLTCSFEDWISLLANRYFLFWGITSRRLIFKGKVSFFRVLPKVDFRQYRCDWADRVGKFERAPSRYWKIPSRILVINASPRAEEGYTYFLLDSFIKGMKKVCAQIEVVQLAQTDIRECCGCWYCWRKGNGRCIFDQQDDGRELLDLMQESDLIVFAFPLYSDGVPSALKNFFDRRVATLEPYMTFGPEKTRHPRRIVRQQSIAVFSICGFVESCHFKAVREHFRALAHNWHMPVAGEIYRPAAMSLFNNPLFYNDQRKVLHQLEIAGEMLVKNGFIASRTKRKIERDFISSRKFRGSANYFWSKHLDDDVQTLY